MTTVQIEGGTLTANLEERVVSGLLLPYGEVGRTNLGRFSVDKGAFSIPADVSILNANLDHDRSNPVATTITLTDTDAGVFGSWRIGRTPEGDDLLAGIQNNAPEARKALSVEATGVAIKDGKAIGGRVFGAAFVKQGAFPSATLLASDIGPDDEDAEPVAAEFTDEQGVEWVRKDTITPETTDEETSSDDETPDEPAEEESEADVATVPNTLTASNERQQPTASQVADMIHTVRTAGADETLMAALSDIKISGTGALPAAGVLQPSWLGEIWAEKSYSRRYMNLIRNGNITAIDEKGFVVDAGTELVKPWAGNKAELPTGTGTTSVLTSTFAKWGFAVDIARELFDIPSARPIIEAFLRKVNSSYARVTDIWTLQQLVAAAGTQVDADTYPSGYNASIGKLIQAIDTVDDSEVEPSFVIVAPDVYTELRYTEKDLIPEYVNFSFGRQGGSADGVTVVRDKSGTLDAGQVLAGGGDVAHVNELGGASPLQIDALDLAHGGIDRAVVGYTQYMTEYADGLVLIGDAV